MLSELKLIQSKLFPQCSNSPRPCWQGCGHELSRPGHSCLKDNKSVPYCETHTSAVLPETEVKPVPSALRPWAGCPPSLFNASGNLSAPQFTICDNQVNPAVDAAFHLPAWPITAGPSRNSLPA